MLRCATSVPGLRRGRLIAAYNLKVTREKIRRIPRYVRALPLELFTRPFAVDIYCNF
jgi:hypothetical protein